MSFLRKSYKQKPQAWGPVSSIQASLFKNAERIGIDPGSIKVAMPMWGPGNQVEYIKNIAYNSNGAAFVDNGVSFNGSSNFISIEPIPAYKTFTYIITFTAKDITGTPLLSFAEYPASGATDRNLYIDNATSKLAFRVYTTSGLIIYSKNALESGKDYSAVCTAIENDRMYLHMNGALQTSWPIGIPYTGYSTPELVIARGYGGTYGQVDIKSLVVLSSGILNLAIDLSDNPYALFQQSRPVLYSLPSGAAPTFKPFWAANATRIAI